MTSTRVPDYVAIGHVTIDRTPRGDVLGGTVLYAALTAARFGLRAAVLTRANLGGLNQAQRAELDMIATEVEIVTQTSASTTIFTNRDVAGRRSQTIHAWGGEIDLSGLPPLWRSAPTIHLAPVAQEIEPRQVARLSPWLLVCTPQGWMRQWSQEHFGVVRHRALRLPAELVARVDALVISSEESVNAREIIDAVGKRGLAAITNGQQGAVLIDRGRTIDIEPFRVRAVEPTGAGDVFAGALFAARSAGESVVASARYAAAAAALKVGGFGVGATPNRAAVQALVEQPRLRR